MYKKIVLLSLITTLSNIINASSLENQKIIKIKDKEYTSINNAIENASYGDIITLSPGTYNENIILESDGVTIKSTEVGQAIVKPIYIKSSNITIDGLKFTEIQADPSNESRRQSIYVKSNEEDINIINCTFKLGQYGQNNNGIRTQAVNKNITIKNNSFENYENAVCLYFDNQNINLINNKLTNNICGFEISRANNTTIAGNEFIKTQGLKFVDNEVGKDINSTVKNNKFISSQNSKHITIEKGKLDASNNFWGTENPRFKDIISDNINSKPYFQDESMNKLSNQVYSVNLNNHPNNIQINDKLKLEVIVDAGYDATPMITFKSSNHEIASVNNEGEITGINTGHVDISVLVDEKIATTKLRVTEPLEETEKPSDEDKPLDIEKPGETEKPSDEDKPLDIEKPEEIEKPSYEDEPSDIEKPLDTDKQPSIDAPPIINKPSGLPTQDNKPTVLFTDIQEHWAKNQIQKFIDKGYICGYTDNTFIPNRQMTRAEFIAIINRVFDLSNKGQVEFIDINKNQWYYNDICVASTYINGYADGTFRPNDFISREEVAVIVSKLIDLKEEKISSYNDTNEISYWSKDAINKLSNSKIMIGYENGMFRPKEKMTRAEAVVTLSRVK